MNISRTRGVYITLIIVFVGIIITSVYALLGGFEEVHVYQMEPVERTVIGRSFYSHYTDEAPVDFGRKCREMLENGDVEGTLTRITFQSDTLAQNHLHQFVGITLSTEMAEVPTGFEVREFSSKERFAVFLSMHVLVQPRPHTIEAMIRDKASADGYQLRDYFYELRYLDNSLSVEGWVE
ncbi:hypothetical protein [Marinoscillum furvescens]|uniref:GyrI-like small molecule binding protein n=1 Tax=Marinoscillum furvescens DSM 4134 TaxID=1122208 RepID=A0A3D9L787_MARFU|nr:hypothetical protein [Marinoscillum furvescens]REE00581.1 hypothetical protein C7460_105210 [Marinoscillum furvescens DSM 4134]